MNRQQLLDKLYKSNTNSKQENYLSTFDYISLIIFNDMICFHGGNNRPINNITLMFDKHVKIVDYVETIYFNDKTPTATLAAKIIKLLEIDKDYIVISNGEWTQFKINYNKV